MKVLHFFKTAWPDSFGGIEQTIHTLVKGGSRFGIQSSVLSLSKNPDLSDISVEGGTYHKSKLDFHLASTGFSLSVFKKFRDLSAKADVIHYHFPWPLMDISQLLLNPGKPAIVTYHSDIVKQKNLLRVYTPIMHRFLASVDCIVATSPDYARTSDTLSRFSQKTTIVPLGLNEADYPLPSEATLDSWRRRFTRPFFLFVGVLRYYKGLDILLDAASAVDADIVIVGDGPLKPELMAKADRLHLDNVHFVGAVADQDKIALLQLCRAFVFPSNRRSEAFGLSLVEATMFGVPMVTAEIGTGTSFVNIDGQTGLVVAPDDAEALSRAMRTLLDDQATAKRLGRNARKRFEEILSAERMCGAYADLYHRLGKQAGPA